MKILWITYFGSWTLPLLNRIAVNNEVKVIVPVNDSDKNFEKIIDNIRFEYVGLPGNEPFVRMTESIYNKRYKRIIDSFAPDIIHVHGTEKNLAQIQHFVPKIPVVVSIQGLLSGCLRFNTAFLSNRDVMPFKSIKNLFGFGGLYYAERVCLRGTKNYENDIIEKCKYFIGRTNWDKAHIMLRNPQAHYYVGNELLRPSFYEVAGSWNVNNMIRHTIFMPSGFNPLKGLHLAVKAVSLLKNRYPDIKLIIPGLPFETLNRSGLKAKIKGEEYLLYIRDFITKKQLVNNICFLPRLNEKEMAMELLKANVFLSPSTIDNSPNAVAEATMLGLPIVVTPVGGVPSFMHDNVNCLFAPSGDIYMMAYQIMQLFEDDNLANRLSKAAYTTALSRHNIESTTEEYLNAYNDVINLHKQQ